jgi:tRNA(adenine34) deaminase
MITFLMGSKKMTSRRQTSPAAASLSPKDSDDELHMAEIIHHTARTLDTASPVPFGALIVETATGKRLVRAVNAVRKENDPSSHAELRAVRKATRKLGKPSLKGFTLYTTCEPCPMCMANALWAGLDRVVFAATIADASRHCKQIHISARELNRRSDMPLDLTGPILRKQAYALFTHPNMLALFASWNPKTPNPKTPNPKTPSVK